MITKYKAEIKAANDKLLEQYGEARAQHKATCLEIEQANEVKRAAYEEEVREVEENDGFRARHHQWKIAKARWDAANRGAIKQWLSNIGIIYEHYSKGGPMAVNGCPTFFSCRLMHIKDWHRAIPAINREQERRQHIELGPDEIET